MRLMCHSGVLPSCCGAECLDPVPSTIVARQSSRLCCRVRRRFLWVAFVLREVSQPPEYASIYFDCAQPMTIHIDTEGSEWALLPSIGRFIAARATKPSLIVEMHGDPPSPAAAEQVSLNCVVSFIVFLCFNELPRSQAVWIVGTSS